MRMRDDQKQKRCMRACNASLPLFELYFGAKFGAEIRIYSQPPTSYCLTYRASRKTTSSVSLPLSFSTNLFISFSIRYQKTSLLT